MAFSWVGAVSFVAVVLLAVHLIKRVRARREAVLWFLFIAAGIAILVFGYYIRVGG